MSTKTYKHDSENINENILVISIKYSDKNSRY